MSRVLFFTTSLGRGGAESHLVRLVNELARSEGGIQAEVAVLYPGEYATNVDPAVPIHVLGTDGGSISAGLLRATSPLRRLILDRRPDIVFAVMDLPALAVWLALRGLGRTPAFAVSVQNPPALQFEIERTSLSRVAAAYARFRLVLTRKVYRTADVLVAISHGVREDIARFAPEAASKVRVIYNAGYDDEGDSAQLAEADLPRPLVVACGRLVYQKGFDVLVDAFVGVRDQVPQAMLWVLGEGPLRSALESRAAAAGLEGAVVFKGFKDNPEAYMGAADVFVLSSRYEGFGNVVTEAMASGTAVVATDCPYGPGEIVEPGVSGVLVPPEDTPALSDALVSVLTDDALRKRLATAGARRARDFHATESAARHRDLFRSLEPNSP